jgi:hypothetical protein
VVAKFESCTERPSSSDTNVNLGGVAILSSAQVVVGTDDDDQMVLKRGCTKHDGMRLTIIGIWTQGSESTLGCLLRDMIPLLRQWQ